MTLNASHIRIHVLKRQWYAMAFTIAPITQMSLIAHVTQRTDSSDGKRINTDRDLVVCFNYNFFFLV